MGQSKVQAHNHGLVTLLRPLLAPLFVLIAAGLTCVSLTEALANGKDHGQTSSRNAEAASVPLDGLTTSGLPTIDVRYYRYPPSYYYRGRHPSYVSRHCYNRDEIRELQRMWPETNWPRSMRCFPYR